MANYRPAGFSDEDTDSDDYGAFIDTPVRRYQPPPQTEKKKIEIELQDAIINGNLPDVQKIITCDLKNNVNLKLDSGWSPLMHACFHAQDKIVQYLLTSGADPNLHADSMTPIMAACSNTSANNDTIFSIISMLIDKESILNVGDKYGQTPLMRAISSGLVAVVELLLEKKVNIEMRDQHGWTAVFWAVHHNQPEILEILIAHDARLTEVDRSGRTPLDIAVSHDHLHIIEILEKYVKKADETDLEKSLAIKSRLRSWHEYYPGVVNNGRPTYTCEIPHLLHGMNCERLTTLIDESGIDLRTFLLLKEDGMTKLGIDMPYERQRLKLGIRNFHLRGWKINAVAGLNARKADSYSVLDCLTSLGTHLQQVYILEATLQYTLREYLGIKDQLKYEPPDSPVVEKMQSATKKLLTNVHNTRKEIRNMKNILSKISSNNPQPADLIKERPSFLLAMNYVTDFCVLCSLGVLAYHAKRLIVNLLPK